MKKILFVLVTFLVCFTLSCSESVKSPNEKKDFNKTVSEKEKADETFEIKEKDATKKVKSEAKLSEKSKSTKKYKLAKKACENTDTGDNILLKSQTFPIDFKPFEGACFVTEHNPEFDDPPLGSEIYLYKNGKRIYEFDSRYNPDSATCYVKAVSFQDLNEDNLKDIIVSGVCGVKSGELNGNEVFINTGKDFYTSVEANDKLDEFKKIKDIANFVRNNKEIFTK